MKKLAIAFGFIIIIFLCNFLIEREIIFTLFTEDTKVNTVNAEVYLDEELLYKGEIGYQMFGFKGIKKELSGGFHSLKIISNNDKVIEKTIFILPNHFTITWWDVQASRLIVNWYFTPFYFE